MSAHFHPEEYHDTYTEELKEIIDEKAKGKKSRPSKGKKPKVTDVKDIMRMLKESLKTHQHKSA